jgi:hypothetical protein
MEREKGMNNSLVGNMWLCDALEDRLLSVDDDERQEPRPHTRES